MNATACLLANSSARACLAARDAMQSDYFLLEYEQTSLACNEETARSLICGRFAFVAALEHMATDAPRLLRLVVGNTTFLTQQGVATRTVPGHTHKARKEFRHIGGALSAAAEASLRSDLSCDFALWRAVLAVNGHTDAGWTLRAP